MYDLRRYAVEKEVKKEEAKKEEKKAAGTAAKKTSRTTAAKTATEKKTTTRKAASAKTTGVKPNVVLQYADKSINYDTLIQNAKNVWEFDMQRKVSEIKEINLYVKPDEGRVYFVVNNSETGDFAL